LTRNPELLLIDSRLRGNDTTEQFCITRRR